MLERGSLWRKGPPATITSQNPLKKCQKWRPLVASACQILQYVRALCGVFLGEGHLAVVQFAGTVGWVVGNKWSNFE